MSPTPPAPADDPLAERLHITRTWWIETWFCLLVWLAAVVVTSVGVPVWGWSPWWLILTGFSCLAIGELVRQLLDAAWLTHNANHLLRVLDGEGGQPR